MIQGTGNISADPLFVDADADFHLLYISPCINTGNPDAQYVDPDGSPNDMGVYGGQNAMLPYYVWVDDDILSGSIQRSTYRFTGNPAVQLEDELFLAPGSILQFETNQRFDVYGTIISDGIQNLPITYDAINDSWHGIKGYAEGSILDLNYCQIFKAETGIESNDQILLENTLIHACDYALWLQNTTDADIINNEINGNNEYGLVAVQSNYSIDNCVIMDNNRGGMYIAGLSPISGTIENCEISYNGSIGAETENGGIVFYASSPFLRYNDISANIGHQVQLYHGSEPVFYHPEEAINSIYSLVSTYYPIFSDEGFPRMDYGHNNVSNGNSASNIVIYDGTENAVLRHIRENYWGVAIPDGDMFQPPTVTFDYRDYSAQPYSMGDLPPRGIQSLDSIEVFYQAINFEMIGCYSEAQQVYENIIAIYPNLDVAVASLGRIFICEAHQLIPDWISLQSYYNSLIAVNAIQEICERAIHLSTACNIVMGEYDSAVQQYLSTLNNPHSSAYSIFAAIDFDLFSQLFGSSVQNIAPNENKNDLIVESSKMFSLLRQITNENNADVLVPDEFFLSQNYPNPFNPTTIIEYGLPERSMVKIAVFNISGQQICNLKNDILNAGYYRIQWNGTNNTGYPLSSGLYFAVFETVGQETGMNYYSVKKMMLIK